MPENRSHSAKSFLKNCLAIVTLMTAATTMAKSNQLLYFILTKDNRAEKKTKTGFKTKNEAISVLKGSLWYVDDKEFQEMSRRSTALLHSAESKDLSLTCELQDITRLKDLEFYLLYALTTCKERDALHSDNRRFLEVTQLYEAWKEVSDICGNYPRVEARDERLLTDPIYGTLKYVGEIPSKSGFWFGIEMDTVCFNISSHLLHQLFSDIIQFYHLVVITSYFYLLSLLVLASNCNNVRCYTGMRKRIQWVATQSRPSRLKRAIIGNQCLCTYALQVGVIR